MNKLLAYNLGSVQLKWSFLALSYLLFTPGIIKGQTLKIDSLKNSSQSGHDTAKVISLLELGQHYTSQGHYDSALLFYFNALKIAELQPEKKFVIKSLSEIADLYAYQRKVVLALDFAFKALELAKKEKNTKAISSIEDQIGLIYFNDGQYRLSLTYALQRLKSIEGSTDKEQRASAYMRLGDIYRNLNSFDSAILFQNMALKELRSLGNKLYISMCLNNLANVYERMGNYNKTIEIYHESLRMIENEGSPEIESIIYQNLSTAYSNMGELDKAIVYAKKALDLFSISVDRENKRSLLMQLAGLYAGKKDFESAYTYLLRYTTLSDSLNSSENQQELLNIRKQYENEQKESEISFLKKTAQLNAKTRNILIGGSIILFLGLLYIARLYFLKRKSAAIIKEKNIELSSTLSNLKATQTQLIQSEKMASLGQLTAGIAHEIQNPLNFVNNFSDVNTELLNELQAELKAHNNDSALMISNDIIINEQKINFHGKRADEIVKNMLQHSRNTPGKKEKVDLNALVDEFLRLAYHGWRARDKSFNTLIVADPDTSIGMVEMNPQEIGRVLLNLFNNAFYAVNEKNNSHVSGYEPAVTVTTRKMNNTVEIRVTDNGVGMGKEVIEKIFQPFFTTKPTGQGTGLGLSLAYDIVKAHGGELKVETKEGEGSSFVILLPC